FVDGIDDRLALTRIDRAIEIGLLAPGHVVAPGLHHAPGPQPLERGRRLFDMGTVGVLIGLGNRRDKPDNVIHDLTFLPVHKDRISLTIYVDINIIGSCQTPTAPFPSPRPSMSAIIACALPRSVQPGRLPGASMPRCALSGSTTGSFPC